MTPGARVEAAIEILDQIVASTREDGPPADAIVAVYFRARRYAGSSDRRTVREWVFRAIRRAGERPESGRSAMVGLAVDEPTLHDAFDGGIHAPAPIAADESGAPAVIVPRWIEAELSPHLATLEERAALITRAPLDLRVNVARADRDAVLESFDGAAATALSPWGIRLGAELQVEKRAEFAEGLVEVQDEGSQLVALACQATPGMRCVDLCAGAGGKSLALAAAAGNAAEIIACDTNRARLSRLGPRADRAGASIDLRLLNASREEAALADLAGTADLVLVDAPCSGSGTWRRNPEGRWRLTPDRLARVEALQHYILDLAAPLVRPGGALVFAVCSLLPREGWHQIDRFLGRHSGWDVQDPLIGIGRSEGSGRLLTPGHDRTDGFFIARLIRS